MINDRPALAIRRAVLTLALCLGCTVVASASGIAQVLPQRSCDLATLAKQPSSAANQAAYLVCLMLGKDPVADSADTNLALTMLTQRKITTPIDTLHGPLPMQEVIGLMYNPGSFSTSARQVFNFDQDSNDQFIPHVVTVMTGTGAPEAIPLFSGYSAQLNEGAPRQYLVSAIMNSHIFDENNLILAFALHGQHQINPERIISGPGPISVDPDTIEAKDHSVKVKFKIGDTFTGSSVRFFLAILDANNDVLASVPEFRYEVPGTNDEVAFDLPIEDLVPPGSYTLAIGARAEKDEGPRILFTLAKPVVSDVLYGQSPSSTFTVQYDVHYGPHASQKMDLIIPTNASQIVRPAIITIHGGGLTGGAKKSMEGDVEMFATDNYVVANIDYRLARYDSPDSYWPAQLNDVRAALQYVKQNAAALGVDPTKICVLGGSAGARLAIWLGVNHDVACVLDNSGAADFTYEPLMKGGQSPWATPVTQGYDLMPGKAIGWPEQFGGAIPEPANDVYFKSLSSINLVTANSAPSFVTAGYYDDNVSWAEGNQYANALKTNNVVHVYYPYCGGHVFGGCTNDNREEPACVPHQGAKAVCDRASIMNQELWWMNSTLSVNQTPAPTTP